MTTIEQRDEVATAPASPAPAPPPPPSRRDVPAPGVPPLTADVRIFLAVIFMLPVQIQTGGLSRLAPADALLGLLVLLSPGVVRFRSKLVDLLPLALVATLAYGTLLALVRAGDATNHTLLVKLAGSLLLGLLAVVTATYARAGHALRTIKVLIVGMSFWGLVAYIDYKVVDILPFVAAKTSSRFGGMQYDPNNAGAAYAVTLIVGAVVGRRAFAHRGWWATCMAISAAALALTLSRGGYVALVGASVVVLLVQRPTMQRSIRAVAIGVLVALVAVASGVVGSAIDDFANRPDTVTGREDLAENGIRLFVESRGLGIGLGTYRATFDEHIIHNTALWLVVEMSLVGLALYVLMVSVPAVAALRIRRHDRVLGAALLGGHVAMVIASAGIEALYQRQWWVIVGLVAGVGALGERASPTTPSIGGRASGLSAPARSTLPPPTPAR